MSRWCLHKPFLCNVRALMERLMQPRALANSWGALLAALQICILAEPYETAIHLRAFILGLLPIGHQQDILLQGGTF